jgi:hypothetical protein
LDAELTFDAAVLDPPFFLMEAINGVVTGLHEEPWDITMVFVILEKSIFFGLNFLLDVEPLI